ncbi:hypothetical protein Rhopal_000102-T1 [Rhodotorula paludigena]|uniref:RRM domain-containing protein n=1 Tax=Rhodotorula paludigena TaxID=86838 RepID=A0AAV5GDJ5_9BASI|nr:hypothetical protein Rhopal_000102-T1 [Rhodotorula paludigena]
MASLLERTLGAVKKDAGDNRRTSGGGQSRGSPYSRPTGDSWKHDRFEKDESADSDSRKPARAGAAAGSSAAGSGPSAKLVIRNLHYEVSERELELLFVQIGPIAAGPKIKGHERRAEQSDPADRQRFDQMLDTAAIAYSHTTCLFLALVRPVRLDHSSASLASFGAAQLQFDRSGRSQGVAWVTYGSEKHAAQAKEAFDGAMAKGEPIQVDFDYHIDRASERGAAAPGSLLSRLGGSSDSNRGPRFANDGPSSRRASGPRTFNPRNERGVGSAPRGERGERGERGGRGGRGGGRGARGEKREPKTNDDLDRELEAFMKAPPADGQQSKHAPAAASGGDVEMS